MAKCARCHNDAVTRVRYQTHQKATDVCEMHHQAFQQAAASAGLRLVYDDGVSGVETAAEMLAALRALNKRLDVVEGKPAEPPPRPPTLRTVEDIQAELREALARAQPAAVIDTTGG